MIQNSFNNDSKYDLIMTDLQMEHTDSGYEVVKEGLKHATFSFIVTGMNYNKEGEQHHGPSTHMIPSTVRVDGKKDKEYVWKELFDSAKKYLESNDLLYMDALKRHIQYFKKPFDNEILLYLTVEMYKR